MARTLLFIAALLAGLLASGTPFAAAAVEPASPGGGSVRWAYYVPDDPSSLASLRQRAGGLDYVGLHWANMRADGSVEMRANADVISLVRSLGARPILSVTAGPSAADTARAFLATETTRAAAADNLARASSEYDGIGIDFEGLYPEDRAALTQFMAQLAARLRPAGKLVSMALSAKAYDTQTVWAGALDYAALAPNADLFVLMAYGFRTARSTAPGSTAPMPWVESILSYAVSQIPPEKLLLGMGVYGYDWDTTAGPPAQALRCPDALALAAQQVVPIEHDQTQQSAHFSYIKDGHTHEVWFEDAASVEARLPLAARYGLAGVSVWRLGQEDPAIWSAIKARLAPVPSAAPTIPAASATPTPTAPATLVTTVTPAPPAPTPTPATTTATSRWYFAEGSTAPPFDTWILLQNPSPMAAIATVTFMKDDGTTVVRRYLLDPTSRFSLFANEVVPNAAISTLVEADRPIFAERAMYFRTDGHGSPGIREPVRTWYLAEGSTAPPFDTWILVMNPNPTPARVTFTFMAEGGVNQTFVHTIAATSRYSVFANLVMPGVSFSTRVEGDQPIIVERAMYFQGGGGHGTTAVTAPSKTWYLAEGDTRPGFDTWLLLMNPNDVPAQATVTFAREDGMVLPRGFWVGPRSRVSVFVNQVMPGVRLSLRVEADQPLIAERAMYFGSRGGHDTVAAPRPDRVWYLAEGSTAPPFTEQVLVANPGSSPVSATVTWMQEGGRNTTQSLEIGANARATIDVNQVVPNSAVSAKVEASAPVVVERSMYFANGNGATNTIGIPSGSGP